MTNTVTVKIRHDIDYDTYFSSTGGLHSEMHTASSTKIVEVANNPVLKTESLWVRKTIYDTLV